MRCADRQPNSHVAAAKVFVFVAALIWLAGCSVSSDKRGTVSGQVDKPAVGKSEGAPSKTLALPPPATPKNWQEARKQAAHRLAAANPDLVYLGKPPDILMAIPVLTVELNADGSVRAIEVMRYPSQAREMVDVAKAAIHRAAPFGDVSKLPKPWRFNETFLFNDDGKFKPMTLDQR